MRQTIIRCSQGAASNGRLLPVLPVGYLSWDSTFGASEGKVALPTSGAFNNFVLMRKSNGVDAATTVTLRKNGVNTALSISLGVGVLSGADTTNTVTVAQGDDVEWVWASASSTAADAFLAVDFVPDSEEVSVYGISPSSSAINAGAGVFGGALGNGRFQSWTSPSTKSNFYSIASCAGSITRLFLRNYHGDLGASVATGYILLNGVRQDGTGGTVDTSVVLTGTTVSNFKNFTLPVANADRVEIIIVITVANLAFALSQFSASVCFAASTAGQYIVCGGDNNSISTSATGWIFVGSPPLPATEDRVLAPIGIPGLTSKGLLVELTNAPGVGTSWDVTLRKNSSNTAATLRFTGSDLLQSIATTDTWSYGDLIDLGVVPTNTPALTQMHWALTCLSPDAIGAIHRFPPISIAM